MTFSLLVQPPHASWERCFRDWDWLLHGPFRPVAFTLFGDALIERPGGEVLLLDALEGELRPVVASRRELDAFLRMEEGRELLLADMAEVLWEQGVRPEPHQCYGYKLPPVLGGGLGLENIQLFDREIYMSLQGQLHRQLRFSPSPKE
jgi:hypothetical protein